MTAQPAEKKWYTYRQLIEWATAIHEGDQVIMFNPRTKDASVHRVEKAEVRAGFEYPTQVMLDNGFMYRTPDRRLGFYYRKLTEGETAPDNVYCTKDGWLYEGCSALSLDYMDQDELPESDPAWTVILPLDFDMEHEAQRQKAISILSLNISSTHYSDNISLENLEAATQALFAKNA